MPQKTTTPSPGAARCKVGTRGRTWRAVAPPDPPRRLQGAPWRTPSCPVGAKRTSTATSAGR